LAGLPPEELPRLRETLAASNAAAVRTAAPALFDLVGSQSPDDADPLRRALPDLPALTAASDLLGAPWSARDILVELGPACAQGTTRCVPLFSAPATDPLERRGRALAWALGNAAILRAPASTRPALIRALRAAPTVALVFDSTQGILDGAQFEQLQVEARRALGHLPPNAAQRAWLESLDRSDAHWALPVPLGPDEVLVVPRLSALARLPRFESDLNAAGAFEWIVRPGA
jgi:hypothetical protein